MLSFVLILVSVAIYGLVHSVLASLWAKARARSWLGPLGQRTYRLMYNLFAVVSFLPVLALVAALPDQTLYSIPFPWVILTLAGQALALLTVLAGVLQTGMWSFLGVQQLLQTASDEAPRLVVRGLYRWVRHPLYTAGLVFIWLTPVITLNLLALYIGLSIYLVVGAIVEERKLLVEFGQAYAEYRRRTPMLIPFPPRSETS